MKLGRKSCGGGKNRKIGEGMRMNWSKYTHICNSLIVKKSALNSQHTKGANIHKQNTLRLEKPFSPLCLNGEP